MKAGFLLAAAGVIVLTGCTSNEVMKPRYVQGEGPEARQEAVALPVDDVAAPAPAEDKRAAEPAAPAVVYAPMTGVKSSGGIPDVGSRSRVSRRAAAPAGKGSVYVVRKGDTIGKIAYRFRVSSAALCKANNIADANRLYVGQKLTIPGGKSVSGKTAGKTAAKAGADTAAEKGYYIVRPGDFPERIARRHKVKVADLLKANNLTAESSRSLQVGQKLIIPGKGAAAAAPVEKKEAVPAVEAAPAADAAAPAEKTAEKPAADAPAVDAANDLARELDASAPESAAAGAADVSSVITKPVVVDKEISIEELAAQYKVTVDAIRATNKDIVGNTIPQGTTVFIPSK